MLNSQSNSLNRAEQPQELGQQARGLAGGPHCQWEVSVGLCRSVDRNQNGGARLLALFEKPASRRECPSWRFQTLFNAVADGPLSGVLQHSGNTSRVNSRIGHLQHGTAESRSKAADRSVRSTQPVA